MTPDKVARKAVNGLFKNKAEVIPGYTNKLFFTLSKWTPHCVISMINRQRIKGKD
jgi:short-subunit dehydrogenase